jgi:DNA repair exonuclease SbcCD nuclease subunit
MTTIDKPQICIISDLHLGVHTNSAYWHGVALKWAKWLRDDLRAKGIKDIMFCGDWHHNRSEISVSTLQVSADILEILGEFNMISILGNHDVYYKHRIDVNSLSIFKGRKNINIIDKPQTIKAFNRTITLCPWETSTEDIPKSDVVFGHFEIETFKMNQYKVCEEGTKIKDILAKSELIISGHFHTRHEKKYSKGTILYVGNPFQMDFGDVNNTKGYHILDLETLNYEFFPNTVSPVYKKLKLSELILHGNITTEMKRIFKQNIVKLVLDRKISREDLETLTNRLRLLKPEQLIMEYDTSLSQSNNLSTDKDLSGIDIHTAIEEFISMLDVEDSDSILNTTLDLYKKCIV